MTESPKSLFLQVHSEVAAEIRKLAQERPLRLGLSFTLSQMAFDGATQEQLAGAKRFADILTNIGDPDEKVPPFPQRELKNG